MSLFGGSGLFGDLDVGDMFSPLKSGIDQQTEAISRAGEERAAGFKKAVEAYESVADIYQPYMDLGTSAVQSLQDLMTNPSSITSDPGYEFRLSEGLRGLQQKYSSVGKMFSGQGAKDLMKYGQDYASAELDKAYTRYGNLANLGYGASTSYDAAKLNLADLYAGQGQSGAKMYEDWSKYVAGHEQFGREMFRSWFGGDGFFGGMAGKGGGGG